MFDEENARSVKSMMKQVIGSNPQLLDNEMGGMKNFQNKSCSLNNTKEKCQF